MLKLTYQGNPIWVAIQHMVAICVGKDGTEILLTNQTSALYVKETAEEIMAMEAMVYHLHPAMIIDPNRSFAR